MIRQAPLFLAAFALLPAAAPAQPPAAAAAVPAPGAADQRLRRLYEAEWAWRLQEDAQTDEQGPGSGADRLPRVDPASQAARLAYWQRTLAELDSIPVAELSPEEKINAAVFRTMIEELAGDVRWRTYEAPFNSDSFFWTLGSRSGFADADQYRRYLGRLRDIPRYFGENVANMRAGLARGFSVPRVTLTGRDETIAPFTRGDETNPLYAPFQRMPANRSRPPSRRGCAPRAWRRSARRRSPPTGRCSPSSATITWPAPEPRSARRRSPRARPITRR